MIERVEIQNFQSHEHSVLEFCPGVNVIVGQSEQGKSAIARALFWLIFNQPLGDGFRSRWGGSTEVHVDLSDGGVSRIKNRKFNGYVLGTQDEFEGFRSEIPGPISSFINLREINFQESRERPFMIGWSAGEVGTFLNEIADLQIIDSTISRNKNEIKRLKGAIKHVKQNIEDDEKELKDFTDLDEMDGIVAGIEELLSQTTALDYEIRDIDALIRQYESIQEDVKDLNDLAGANTKPIYDALKSYNATVESIEELDRLIQDYEKQQEIIKSNKELIVKYSKERDRLMPERCPLCGGPTNGKANHCTG